MSEMIVRVARAICDSLEADDFDELAENSIVKAAYMQQARAAIEAIFAESRFTEFRGMTVLVNPAFPACFWNGKELREIDAALASPEKEK